MDLSSGEAIKAAETESATMIRMCANKIPQKLSYFPQIKVVHTSKLFHGQLYVPLLNWLLMIGTVLVAVVYNNVGYPDFHNLPKADRISRQPLLEMLMGMISHNSVFGL
jgi:K+ potassium transporter